MATATTHIPTVTGCAGQTRCFKLSPPKNIEGTETEYVSISVTPRYGVQSAEVRTYPASETGAVKGNQVLRRIGSFTIDGQADDPDYLNGCYWLALQLLGGYVHEEVEPEHELAE